VDTVDKPAKPEDMGMTCPLHSGCGVDSVRRAFSLLWTDSGESTHSLSTTNAHFQKFPYFDRAKNHPPYMGVPLKEKTAHFGDFSTREGTYPQITVGYPQIGCLNKRD
jgi:hypothetical protein